MWYKRLHPTGVIQAIATFIPTIMYTTEVQLMSIRSANNLNAQYATLLRDTQIIVTEI